MINIINPLFFINNYFPFWGGRVLSIGGGGWDMSNGTFDINYQYTPPSFYGDNSTLNIYVSSDKFKHTGLGAIVNLYKENSTISLSGAGSVANLYAPNQTVYMFGANSIVNQYSYRAEIVIRYPGGSVVNMLGWNSLVRVISDGNKINLGPGSNLRADVSGRSNILTMNSGHGEINLYGFGNIAYLKGPNQVVYITGKENIAELEGGVGVNALVSGQFNVVNIRGSGGIATIQGEKNTVNLYQTNQAAHIFAGKNVVNLYSQSQIVNLAGLSAVASIFNVNSLRIKGESYAKISIGSTACTIDVSLLRSGVIYQAIGNKNSIIGNNDQRIAVMNTSLAFFTSALASLGPPPLPAGANISIATSALSPQTAVTVAT